MHEQHGLSFWNAACLLRALDAMPWDDALRIGSTLLGTNSCSRHSMTTHQDHGSAILKRGTQKPLQNKPTVPGDARARAWPGRRPATGWMPKRTLMPLPRSTLTSSAMSYCAPATASPYLPRQHQGFKAKSSNRCLFQTARTTHPLLLAGHCCALLS